MQTTIEDLPPKMRECYIKVTEYLKKNPEVSQIQAIRTLGLNSSQFAKAKFRLFGPQKRGPKPSSEFPAKRPYTKKSIMHTLEVPEVPSTNVVMLVVPQNKLSVTLKELLGV